MSPHPTWRLLPVAAPGVPNLLVSTAFSDDSYTVHLTDLANVWVERIERKPIIQRALAEDTSIDPSDGPDQLRRMLELIRAAFESNDPENYNSSLSIAREDNDDSLAIHVTCILPEPLKPLKWPMHLRKCPQSNVATNLVLPLIQAHEARMREIDHLFSSLKEKDNVITRLADKLEATGTGLEQVFSALSGKRRVTRAAAESKVKGLAPFSAAEFKNRPPELRSVTQKGDVSTLLDSVFGAGGLTYEAELDLEASNVLNDWWVKFGKGKPVTLSQRSGSQPSKSRSPPPTVEVKVEDDDDDDFQVQAAPPHLPSIRKHNVNTRPTPAELDDDETSDGEDDGLVSSSTRQAKGSALDDRPKASGARLGALGGLKARSRSPLPERTPPKRAASQAVEDNTDSETASDTASDDDKEKERSAAPPSPARQPPRRGGLGRIGGTARKETPSPKPATSPAHSPSRSPAPDKPDPLPRRHKLGTIGKRSSSPGSNTIGTQAPDDGRGRSKITVDKPKPRETSQDRADRKRAELQKDLEKRAAAGPAKKKRKF